MDAGHAQVPWQVLLIAGSSGVGKTLAAQRLAKRGSISHLLVDDVRLALQAVTTPSSHPDLYVFLNYRLEQWRDAETVRDDWRRVGQALLRPLQAIVSHHVAISSSGRIILEGDGLLPALGQPNRYFDQRALTSTTLIRALRTVVLVEEDEDQLLHNLRARGRGFENWGQAEQTGFAHASWLWGQWLKQEAIAHGIPVIASQPWLTLPERLLRAIA